MVNHILIPRFVQNVLKRNKLPLSTVADFNKVRELLSVNDIVLIQTLQRGEYWKTLLSITPVEDNMLHIASDMRLYDLWYASSTEENKAYLVNILGVLVESGQAKDEIAERLFNNDGGATDKTIDGELSNDPLDNVVAQAQEPETLPYEIIDIGSKYYGIILDSGVFPNREFSNKLIKDILRSSYLYCSQSEVAQTQLFRLYMNRL